jgi:hypothetical protein
MVKMEPVEFSWLPGVVGMVEVLVEVVAKESSLPIALLNGHVEVVEVVEVQVEEWETVR